MHVHAVQGDVRLEASVPVLLKDPPELLAGVGGIPEPVPVNAPAQPWRSRMRGAEWQYNDAHPDFTAVRGSNAARLRYLIRLYAKELVSRNFGRPGDDEVLERLVEVLTHLDVARRATPDASPDKDAS